MYNLQNIKRIAEEKKATIRELATHCGISDTGLHKSIAMNSININTLDKIAEYLKVTVTELIGENHAGVGVVSSPSVAYGKEKPDYKLLFDLQKEISDLLKELSEVKLENAQLKNDGAPVQSANAG